MKLFMRPAGVLLLAAGFSACDVPTGIPRWETTWITPGESTTISVAELLPGALDVTPDTSAFVFSFDPLDVTWQLADFCAACPPTALTVPKPAFTGSVQTTMPLPADIRAVVVESGAIDLELAHTFDFDPLRPGAAADSGSLTITVRSGGVVVANVVIDGADQAFAPGDTLRPSLAFIPSTIADALEIEFLFDSPAGDVTTVDPADEFSASMSSDGVLVSSATIAVSGQEVTGVESELDLSAVDLERMKAAALIIDIDNPFAVNAALTLAIDPEGPAGPFVRPIDFAPGTTQVVVEFDEQETAEMVGTVNTMTVDGTVSAIGGELTVEPDMEITLTTRLRVTVEVGGDDSDDSEI